MTIGLNDRMRAAGVRYTEAAHVCYVIVIYTT
jgi:hypothetical protein